MNSPEDAATLPRDVPSGTVDLAAPGCPAEPVEVVAVPGYDIERELGRGGMGVVYQARQTALNRTVALKMFLGGGHPGDAARQRFETEAEAIARLQHPNIQTEKARAQEQLRRAEWLVYAGQLTLARTDFEEGNAPLAVRHLEAGQADLRGWEHRHLLNRFTSKLTLHGHTAQVGAVAFSPDGWHLASASVDQTVRLWDATKGGNWPLPDAAERQRYHSEQAAVATKERQWFAVAFHLGCLLHDWPDDADLERRREAALQTHAATEGVKPMNKVP